MNGIEIDVAYAGSNNEVVVITTRGYIDTTTAPIFSKRLNELLALGNNNFVINLEGVDYISSTGWGVFIANLREIRYKNGDLVLVNMVPGVHNIYELMEFSSVIKSFTGIERAKEYFLREGVSEVNPEVVIEEKKEEWVPEPPREERVPEPPREEEVSPQRRKIDARDDGVIIPPTKRPEPFTQQRKKERFRSPNILSLAKDELGMRILRVLIARPYYDIKDIAIALRLPEYGYKRVSTLTIKHKLKEMDLLNRKKRYEYLTGKRTFPQW